MAVAAIRTLLDKAGWSIGDVDLLEINEAFAVVAIAAQRDFGIVREKFDINGVACAFGHPTGTAALCIGSGEATAIAVERVVR